jgi:cytochrome b
MAAFDQKARAGGVQPPAPAGPTAVETVRVWDPLVRVFHWALVAAFVVAWLTGDELERLHEVTGYVIMGLLGVRIIWGFIGTSHARFSDFVYRPSRVLGYLADTTRLRAKRYLGHNPAGGVMVIALLLVLAMTAGSGFMMTTDAFWGADWVEEVHEFMANLAIVLVGLHLAGVLVASLEHRENLVRSMITGRKWRDG